MWVHEGQRVIVDSGVDDYYRPDKWREYYRSTKAHNTIEIDGIEQSEIWGNFRVGRRAHPLQVQYSENDLIYMKGAHNGYYHLSDKVVHRRTVTFLDNHILIVFDEITGSKNRSVKSHLHFHPDFNMGEMDNFKIISKGNNFDVIVLPFGNVQNIIKLRGQDNPIQGWYAPEFGKQYAAL